MRGRSLLWAGPGVLLLGGRGAGGAPSSRSESVDAAALGEADDLLVRVPDLLPAPVPGAAEPAPRAAASYAGSSVTKTKG